MFWDNLVLLLPRRMTGSTGGQGESTSLQLGLHHMKLSVASRGHRTEDLCPFISFEQARLKGIL